MRSRVGFAPFIILVPFLALVALVFAGIAAQVRHTLGHLPQVLECQLTAALGRPVHIGKIEGDFWRGLQLRDVSIARSANPADGDLLRARRIRVRYSLQGMVGSKTLPLESIRSVEIDSPYLYVSRDPRGRLNLQDLVKPGPKREGPPPRFLGTATLRNGTIVFDDRGLPNGRRMVHRLTGIQVNVDGRAAPLYVASVEAAGDRGRLGRLAASISANVEEMNVSATARVQGVHLLPWLVYKPPSVKLPVKLAGGVVDVQGSALLLDGKLQDYRGKVLLREGAVQVPQLKQAVHDIACDVDVTPDALVAENVRLRAGKIALNANATVVNFREPWVRARIGATGIHEADVRALVPNLPALPNVRLGRVDNLEVVASGPLANPSARVNLDLTSVSRPEAELSQVHLSARMLGPKQVAVDTFSGRVAKGTVDATATVDLAGKQPRYSARGTLRGLHLDAVRLGDKVKGPLPTGIVSADFQVAGDGATPRAEARVDITDVAWQQWQANAVQADIAYAGSQVEVRRAQVRIPEGLVTAFGSIDLKGPLKLQVAATDLNVGALGTRLNMKQVGGRVYARGEITGTMLAPAFAGEVTAHDLAYGEDRLELLRGKVKADMSGIQVEECHGLMLPAQFGNVSLDLRDPRAGKDAELAVSGMVMGVELGHLARRFKLEGDWAGTLDVEELEVSGPLNALQVTAQVSARNLRGAGHQIDSISGCVTAGLDGAVSIREKDALTVRIGTSEMRAWGTVSADRKLDLRVATAKGRYIHVEEIQAFDPTVLRLKSSLGLNLRITGPVTNPEVRNGAIEVHELVVNGNAFGRGNGEVDASKERVRVNNFVLIGGDRAGNSEKKEQYEIDGTVWPALDATAVVQAVPITKLLQLARVPMPKIDVDGRITGLIKIKEGKPRPQVSLTRMVVDGGKVGPQAIRALTAEGVALEADAVVLNRLHLELPEGAVLDVTGKASLAKDGPLDFQVRGEKLDMALARPWVPMKQAVGGVGRLEATLRGTLNKPELDGSLSMEKPAYGDRQFDSLVARLSFRDNVARASDVVLRMGQYAVQGFAEVPLDWEKKAISKEARIRGGIKLEEQSLDALALFVPLVVKSKGTVSANLDVGGTLASPDLRGQVKVNSEEIILGHQEKDRKPEEALRLAGLDGLIRVETDRVVVERLWLASGKNPKALEVTGDITLRQFMPDQFNLKLAANDYQFEERNLSGQFQERVKFALRGGLSVREQWPSPLVDGDLELRKAKVDASRYVAPPPNEKVRAKLKVSPRFDIRLASEGLELVAMRTKAFTDLTTHVGGDLNDPQISGTATVARGTISLPTANFRIQEAQLEKLLIRPMASEPVRAEGKAVLTTNLRGALAGRKPQGYAVTANVTIDYPRPKDAITMEMTANPFLEEEEIYRLLTRQDVLEQIVAGNEDIGATLKNEMMNYMATALQPRVIEPVERAIADVLGLSEFSIMASFDEPVEVKMGKYLVKGVRVSYTRAMTAREARYKLKVDYEVLRKVSLSWSTDEQRSRFIGLEAGFQF